MKESGKFSGADIFSSLRMPSGIGSVITIEPEGSAIAAAKILALENKDISEKIHEYPVKKKEEIEEADNALKGGQ